MKRILAFLFFISFYSCEKDSISIIASEKFFDPQKLSQLSLDSYEFFWKGEEINHVSENDGGNFSRDSEFLGSIHFSSENKIIWISVFENRSTAISAMEERINDVARVILPGSSDTKIKNKWWYTDCIPDIVFLNQWNTIIEVGYYHNHFSEVKEFLIQSSIELARRVDFLSK